MSDELAYRSPHFNSRPKGAAIRVIVLHADAGASDRGTLDWLVNPDSGVSYHALIGRDGTLYQIVDLKKRAWHAGKSHWNGKTNVNDFSLGLAFANRHDGKEKLTEAQMAVGIATVQAWAGRYPIEAVVTHAMIAPGRKKDPELIPNFRLDPYADAARIARVTAIREASDA